MGTGINAQLGFAEESVEGTYEAVDHFYEFTSESLDYQHELMWSNGLRPGQTSQSAYVVGTHQVSGSTAFELQTGQALLWQAAMGEVATSGAGPYTHVCTPNTAFPSFSIQKGVPGDSTLAYTYVGCKVNQWTLDFQTGEYPMLTLDWLGRDEYNPGHGSAEALATATISTPTRLSFTQGVFSVAGSEVCIDGGSIQGANNLSANYQICAANPGGPDVRADGYLVYTGQATADFEDDTQYQRFRAASSVAVSLVFTSSTHSVTVAGNVVFTGTTPKVPGPSRIKQEMPFQFVPTALGGDAITVTVVNGDSAP